MKTNLEGNPAKRDVFVYLFEAEKHRDKAGRLSEDELSSLAGLAL